MLHNVMVMEDVIPLAMVVSATTQITIGQVIIAVSSILDLNYLVMKFVCLMRELFIVISMVFVIQLDPLVFVINNLFVLLLTVAKLMIIHGRLLPQVHLRLANQLIHQLAFPRDCRLGTRLSNLPHLLRIIRLNSQLILLLQYPPESPP